MRLKLLAIAFTATLAMTLCLTACSSQQASDAASTEAAGDAAVSGESAAGAPEEVLYWAGTLSDGRVIYNMFDATGENAVLSIANPDGSEAEVFSGKMKMTEDGKVTIVGVTDEDAATLSVVGIADDLSALKIDMEGYGEVDLKPIDEAGFIAAIGENATGNAHYWKGTLPDGQVVANMLDTTGDYAVLNIANPDGSEDKYYAGKVLIAGDRFVIIDDESKQSVSYAVVSTDNNALVIDIVGYGKAELELIDEAEFTELTTK